MKVYRVSGKFRMGLKWQNFKREVIEDDPEDAKEKILSLLGSEHRTKRTNIRIRDVEEISEDEVESHYIEEMLQIKG